jgi:aspartate racemase
MRTLGLLGGMAWPSTADAYRLINEEVARRRGGLHSAPLIVWSFDFATVEALQAAGEWDAAGALLADAATRLEHAGAEGLLLCTNTMHLVARQIEEAVDVPLLHIADATAGAIRSDGVSRVGLLGTRFTMEEPFYRDRLVGHGIEALVPPREQRDELHRIIYEELVLGDLRPESKASCLRVVDDLVMRGAMGVIAGCTEIELLVAGSDVPVAYYPTTRLHVLAAVDWILGT